MREVIGLNYEWRFTGRDGEEIINIPHSNTPIPSSHFTEEIYEMVSWYRKSVHIKKQDDILVKLRFYGVQVSTYLYIDSNFVGEHHGGYDMFEFDLTSFISEEKEYLIEVKVDSHEDPNVVPFGSTIDFLTYGGIYREVELLYLPKKHIDNAFIYPTYNENWMLNVEFDLKGSYEVEIEIDSTTFRSEFTDEFRFSEVMQDVNVWDIEHPNLYDVTVRLIENDTVVDEIKDRIGFRIATFKRDGFYLNFKKIKLIGLNRHQSYPDVGYAMPKSMQEQDADILKYDLSLNIVRTSHYPQSKHFIRRCDEIGLLVFTEIIGWQYISQEESWKNQVVENTKNMVLQYRNHPSIVLWGPRINESPDDHNLYSKTNKVAHELDPTRCTSGVRFAEKSECLEDVYGFNDYSHNGSNRGLRAKKKNTSDMSKAYLVTETIGHTWLTKSYDNENHRTEHALRHMNVLESCFAEDEIAGTIAWCMNDYHTHSHFDCGDSICHHGVLNMYRMPKITSYTYASQRKEPFLELNTNMKQGDYPANDIPRIVAFTNCDYIKLYRNDEFIREFHRNNEYPNVPFAPIFIDDLIGNKILENESFKKRDANIIKEILLNVTENGLSVLSLKQKLQFLWMSAKHRLNFDKWVDMYGTYKGNWGAEITEYRVDGYINGEVVVSRLYNARTNVSFDINLSNTSITDGDTYEVIQLRIQAVDRNGLKVPYLFTHVDVSDGDCHTVITKNKTMITGQYSCYVKSNGKSGNSVINIKINGREFKRKIVVKGYKVLVKDNVNIGGKNGQ